MPCDLKKDLLSHPADMMAHVPVCKSVFALRELQDKGTVLGCLVTWHGSHIENYSIILHLVPSGLSCSMQLIWSAGSVKTSLHKTYAIRLLSNINF